MYPTDITISQTLPKARNITVAAAIKVAESFYSAGFLKPDIVVYTPEGNQTLHQALAGEHVNLTDKYPFHLIWLDEDGEPLDMVGQEAAAFIPVKGRPTEFLSRALKTPAGQRIMPRNLGLESDVWTYIRSAAQNQVAQPKYANLMRAVVNTLDNIIGS